MFAKCQSVFLVTFCSLCAAVNLPSVMAQDTVLGKWNVVSVTDEGDIESIWEFSADGDRLAGELELPAMGTSTEFSQLKVAKGELSFSMELAVHGLEMAFDVEATITGDQLEGTWIAFDQGGNRISDGPLKGERAAAAKKAGDDKEKFVGAWSSIAVLPDGTESNGTLNIEYADGKLSGGLSGDTGAADLESILIRKDSIFFAFQLEMNGVVRDLEIEATLQKDGSLEGEWILIMGEEEAATGKWSATKKMKTEILFDGKSLDNFRGYHQEALGAGWKIDGQTLHFDGSGGGDIVTRKQFGDFELTFDWKVSPAGNSGVMYRVTLGDNAPYFSGVEYQILDNEKHADGKNRQTSAAALYALYPPGEAQPKPVGEWNTSKIVVRGNAVQHWLNGEKVVETEIGSKEWNEKVADSKFATWEKFGKSPTGHIAFQDHGDPVWYRNIRIKY